MDLPPEVLRLEAGAGGVAGGALGADTTFDKFSVGGGAFGPGDNSVPFPCAPGSRLAMSAVLSL